jgi:hypothetical protein
MKEKEVRERIERFLKRTARNVVVPASLGLGFSLAGCEQHAFQGVAADAGRDLAGQTADAVSQTADASSMGPDVADAGTKDVSSKGPDAGDAGKEDLPLMAVPYVVAMPEDAAKAQPMDAESEAGSARPDAKADLMAVYPVYHVPLSE